MKMASQFADMTSSSIFLMLFRYFCQVYLLVQVSCQYHYWFWSYGNSFYKQVTRNLEIGNTLVWVFPNIWRLGWVRDTKFNTNVSNKMLLHVAKCQGYSFYCFWIVKGKPLEGSKITLPPPSPKLVSIAFQDIMWLLHPVIRCSKDLVLASFKHV